MYTKSIFIFLLFLQSYCLIAQENIVIRTDRDFYIGGEDVWFQINNLELNTSIESDLSKVVYVELLNAQNKPVSQYKCRLDNGRIKSYFTLSDTISTGNYLMRAYTRWMRNAKEPIFASKVISVVNPFALNAFPKFQQSRASKKSTMYLEDNKQLISNASEELSLRVDRLNYGNREKVTVELASTGIDLSHFTLSVIKKGLYKDKIETYTNYRNDVNSSISIKSENMLLPELEGELICGRISDIENGEPRKGEKFILSFVGQSPVFQLSTSDSLGNFRYVVNRYGKQEMVIQPYDNDTSNLNYKVTLDPSFSENYPHTKLPSLYFSEQEVKQLNEAIVNMQVNTIYSAHQTDSQIKDSLGVVAPFYGKAEIVTVIDKYIELATIEEVIKEITPSTFLKKHRGEYILKVFESNPLFPRDGGTMTFVDGVPVHNLKSILDMDPSELDRIEVVNLNYYIENEEIGRLVCFYTKNGNTGSLDFDSRIFRQARECYHSGYSFVGPNYTLKEHKKSRLADYRNTLYFSNIELDSENKASIDFFTCDDRGKYIVVLQAIDKEGQLRTNTTTFEVK